MVTELDEEKHRNVGQWVQNTMFTSKSRYGNWKYIPSAIEHEAVVAIDMDACKLKSVNFENKYLKHVSWEKILSKIDIIKIEKQNFCIFFCKKCSNFWRIRRRKEHREVGCISVETLEILLLRKVRWAHFWVSSSLSRPSLEHTVASIYSISAFR